MHVPVRSSEPASGDPLWAKLSHHIIGTEDAVLPFAARLARENDWRPAHAERVIGEYRRFAYLAVTAGHAVTPSPAVDQAWHLHLLHSRDYWERFCPRVLGAPLHHQPTAGGAAERDRHYAQYADTLAAYERAFGAPPPADIWPAARALLVDGARRRWVDPAHFIVLPKRVATLAVLALAGIAMLAFFR